MEGTQIGTLYKLDYQSITPIADTSDNLSKLSASTTLTTTNSSIDELTLWHNRMGHVNIYVIKQIS